jgi:RNA recognition motif-containing protein
MVGKLPYDMTFEQIAAIFTTPTTPAHGDGHICNIETIRLLNKKRTDASLVSTGVAFIDFKDRDSLLRALTYNDMVHASYSMHDT